MSKRIEYIDIARGVGIILVVMGHNDFASTISPFFYHVIYSFHMPLFFFLSGFFLNISVPFVEYFKKRFNSLLKPYFFTVFLIYFTTVAFGVTMSFQTALLRIVKFFYGAGYYLDWVQLWFLTNLFVVSLYAYLFLVVADRLHNRWLRWGLLLLTLWIGTLFLQTFYPFTISLFGKSYQLYGLPFSLDLVLLSGFYFLLGNEVRQITNEQTFENWFLLIGSGVVLLLMVYFFPQRIDFNTRVYESLIINTLEAIIGIVFILAFSRQIELRSAKLAALFKYFGQISLYILLFHVPIQGILAEKIQALGASPVVAVSIGFVMGIAGSVLIYELFFKTNPIGSWWMGRKAETPEKMEVAGTNTSN